MTGTWIIPIVCWLVFVAWLAHADPDMVDMAGFWTLAAFVPVLFGLLVRALP